MMIDFNENQKSFKKKVAIYEKQILINQNDWFKLYAADFAMLSIWAVRLLFNLINCISKNPSKLELSKYLNST